jgi:hypothetical protein
MSFQKPNFFIIGAPKCGTTSLANWLGDHPNVFMVDIKEPHYFNTDGARWIKSKRKYEKLFPKDGSKYKILAEASTHYIYSKVAIKNILQYSPQSKFLVCIRNPVKMAQSLHGERIYQGTEVIEDFREAWDVQGVRKEGNKIPKSTKANPSKLLYGDLCKIGSKLQAIFKLIDKRRIKVLVLDDIKENPKASYGKILKFLDIKDDERNDFPVYNRSKKSKYPILNYSIARLSQLKQSVGITSPLGIKKLFDKISILESPKESLDPEFENELKDYFKKDINLLSNILGRDLSRWANYSITQN